MLAQKRRMFGSDLGKLMMMELINGALKATALSSSPSHKTL